MTVVATCPRCSQEIRPPGLLSSSWECARHGEVLPYMVHPRARAEVLAAVLDRAGVPVWMPHPLPSLWALTGVSYAGDDRGPASAVAIALAGPSPLGGPVDLVLVAEEIGVGLGAGLAGLDGSDPGPRIGAGAPSARVGTTGHDTPLWQVYGDDERVALAGEAAGRWLWLLAWASAADRLLVEDLHLVDLRDSKIAATVDANLTFGPETDRLRPRGSRSHNGG